MWRRFVWIGFLACILIAAAVGKCWQALSVPELPGYTLEVPEDVPAHLVLVDKEGKQHDGNGRELYSRGHREGWKRCWLLYQQGELDPRDEAAVQHWIPGDYGIVGRGFIDGFKGCQRFLREQSAQ